MKYKSVIALSLAIICSMISLSTYVIPTAMNFVSGDVKSVSFQAPNSKGVLKTSKTTTVSVKNVTKESVQNFDQVTYMIYYGKLNDKIIKEAKKYDIVILNPRTGNITRKQVQKIKAGGTKVLGYISVGEDLRTAGLTPEQMLKDQRFVADGTGPRVDPRSSSDRSFENIDLKGKESPNGIGYASYYLDDNDQDGKPDINKNFNCAFTNIGDPAWFTTLDKMRLDGVDKIAGMREILTNNYGRGLGCDGVLLDTIDTCAPNSYTDDSNPNKTRFEWTAAGVKEFTKRLKEKYPNKLILQNRGLFFYNPQLSEYYKNTPRQYIDFLMFESYMLDSSQTSLYNKSFFADNKYNYAPKIIAEAGRPDGFKILSLGYAEGPTKYKLKDTLLGKSKTGLKILMEDMKQAQNEAGFSHYITDSDITLVNNFVLTHKDKSDTVPPAWSSVYNSSNTWPPKAPKPRVGIGEVEPVENGMIVRWDVALDKNAVDYTLYYQKTPFDFKSDPNLKNAQKAKLVPQIGKGYEDGIGPNTYPYQATIKGLDSGEEYYFVIRAKDTSSKHNEEKNKVVKIGIPLNQLEE